MESGSFVKQEGLALIQRKTADIYGDKVFDIILIIVTISHGNATEFKSQDQPNNMANLCNITNTIISEC